MRGHRFRTSNCPRWMAAQCVGLSKQAPVRLSSWPKIMALWAGVKP